MAVEVHRLAFPALASDLRHTDYLITFAGGYHAEILRFLVDWKIQCKLPPKTKRFCPLVLK
jgi:hypothetical protein